MTIKERVVTWLRARRLRRALRLTRAVDGMVVSRSQFEAAARSLAELVSDVEKSGLLKGQPAKVERLTRRVEVVSGMLADAAELGDPTLQLDRLRELYGRARLNSMGKKQRQRLAHLAALDQLQRRRPPGLTQQLARRHAHLVREATG